MAEPRDDHSSYLASWLDVLKNDNRAIFTGLRMHKRAADYCTACNGRNWPPTSSLTAKKFAGASAPANSVYS
jgi:antirestriction protein ArdC